VPVFDCCGFVQGLWLAIHYAPVYTFRYTSWWMLFTILIGDPLRTCIYVPLYQLMNVVYYLDTAAWYCKLQVTCNSRKTDQTALFLIQFSGRYVNGVNVTSLCEVIYLPVCLTRANVADLCRLLSSHSRIMHIVLQLSTANFLLNWTLNTAVFKISCIGFISMFFIIFFRGDLELMASPLP